MNIAKNEAFNTTEEERIIFRNWDFPLSDFQKQAIRAILQGFSVLITAHTGCGKTLPAEFAVKHFFKIGKCYNS